LLFILPKRRVDATPLCFFHLHSFLRIISNTWHSFINLASTPLFLFFFAQASLPRTCPGIITQTAEAHTHTAASRQWLQRREKDHTEKDTIVQVPFLDQRRQCGGGEGRSAASLARATA
jgi:hypothetical protein